MNDLLLTITPYAIGAGVTLLLLATFRRRRPKVENPSPLDRMLPRDDETALTEDQGAFGRLTPALAAQIPESRRESSDFTTLLRQAGIHSASARMTIYALRFVLLLVPLIGAGVVAIVAPQQWTFHILVAGGLVAATLSIIPRLYVFFRRRRRIREIRHGLADMMDMLSMCLGGGMPLGEGLDHVSKNLVGYPALAQELAILRRQADIGSLRRALADFAERVDLPEARQVAGLLARSETLGTRLSGTLHDQADHFRVARRQQATMQANKMPVKLSLPLLFCFAPAALIILISPALLELQQFFDPAENGRTSVVESLDPVDRTLTQQNVGAAQQDRQFRRDGS